MGHVEFNVHLTVIIHYNSVKISAGGKKGLLHSIARKLNFPLGILGVEQIELLDSLVTSNSLLQECIPII